MATTEALTNTDLPAPPGARLANGSAYGNTGILGRRRGWLSCLRARREYYTKELK